MRSGPFGLRFAERLEEVKGIIFTVNAEYFYWGKAVPGFLDVLRRGVCVADGWWVAKLVGVPRITGTEVLRYLLPRAQKVLIVGGRPEANLRACRKLSKGYKVEIIGYAPVIHYPFVEREIEELAEIIQIEKPDAIVFALSHPKQELIVEELFPVFERVGVKYVVGVGGVIERLAGLRKVPPAWVGKIGLEWLYRLLFEGTWRKVIYALLGLIVLLGGIALAKTHGCARRP